MTNRLPLLSAQLAFGLEAQRSGQRSTVSVRFRMPPSSLSTASVRKVLESVVLQNPALFHRTRFSRGTAYQEQYPAEVDFTEAHVASIGAGTGLVTETVTKLGISLDGAPVAALLIRSPEGDDLLLVFDHASVDEQSLQLIKRQLQAPSEPDGRELARYQAAINDRKSCEDAAADGPGIEFWADQLKSAVGESRVAVDRPHRIVPILRFPTVLVPGSFHGSLFPYVLFSLHRTLREFTEGRQTIIGYPWGGRNTAYSDVVGCFMNTVISLDTTGPRLSQKSVGQFLENWYREIDHADVPFSAVTALNAAFTGYVTAQVTYTHRARHTMSVAGVPATGVVSSHGSIPISSAFEVGSVVYGNEVELALVLDEESIGSRAHEFGARWRKWLQEALSNASGWS